MEGGGGRGGGGGSSGTATHLRAPRDLLRAGNRGTVAGAVRSGLFFQSGTPQRRGDHYGTVAHESSRAALLPPKAAAALADLRGGGGGGGGGEPASGSQQALHSLKRRTVVSMLRPKRSPPPPPQTLKPLQKQQPPPPPPPAAPAAAQPLQVVCSPHAAASTGAAGVTAAAAGGVTGQEQQLSSPPGGSGGGGGSCSLPCRCAEVDQLAANPASIFFWIQRSEMSQAAAAAAAAAAAGAGGGGAVGGAGAGGADAQVMYFTVPTEAAASAAPRQQKQQGSGARWHHPPQQRGVHEIEALRMRLVPRHLVQLPCVQQASTHLAPLPGRGTSSSSTTFSSSSAAAAPAAAAAAAELPPYLRLEGTMVTRIKAQRGGEPSEEYFSYQEFVDECVLFVRLKALRFFSLRSRVWRVLGIWKQAARVHRLGRTAARLGDGHLMLDPHLRAAVVEARDAMQSDDGDGDAGVPLFPWFHHTSSSSPQPQRAADAGGSPPATPPDAAAAAAAAAASAGLEAPARPPLVSLDDFPQLSSRLQEEALQAAGRQRERVVKGVRAGCEGLLAATDFNGVSLLFLLRVKTSAYVRRRRRSTAASVASTTAAAAVHDDVDEYIERLVAEIGGADAAGGAAAVDDTLLKKMLQSAQERRLEAQLAGVCEHRARNKFGGSDPKRVGGGGDEGVGVVGGVATRKEVEAYRISFAEIGFLDAFLQRIQRFVPLVSHMTFDFLRRAALGSTVALDAALKSEPPIFLLCVELPANGIDDDSGGGGGGGDSLVLSPDPDSFSDVILTFVRLGPATLERAVCTDLSVDPTLAHLTSQAKPPPQTAVVGGGLVSDDASPTTASSQQSPPPPPPATLDDAQGASSSRPPSSAAQPARRGREFRLGQVTVVGVLSETAAYVAAVGGVEATLDAASAEARQRCAALQPAVVRWREACGDAGAFFERYALCARAAERGADAAAAADAATDAYASARLFAELSAVVDEGLVAACEGTVRRLLAAREEVRGLEEREALPVCFVLDRSAVKEVALPRLQGALEHVARRLPGVIRQVYVDTGAALRGACARLAAEATTTEDHRALITAYHGSLHAQSVYEQLSRQTRELNLILADLQERLKTDGCTTGVGAATTSSSCLRSPLSPVSAAAFTSLQQCEMEGEAETLQELRQRYEGLQRAAEERADALVDGYRRLFRDDFAALRAQADAIRGLVRQPHLSDPETDPQTAVADAEDLRGRVRELMGAMARHNAFHRELSLPVRSLPLSDVDMLISVKFRVWEVYRSLVARAADWEATPVAELDLDALVGGLQEYRRELKAIAECEAAYVEEVARLQAADGDDEDDDDDDEGGGGGAQQRRRQRASVVGSGVGVQLRADRGSLASASLGVSVDSSRRLKRRIDGILERFSDMVPVLAALCSPDLRASHRRDINNLALAHAGGGAAGPGGPGERRGRQLAEIARQANPAVVQAVRRLRSMGSAGHAGCASPKRGQAAQTAGHALSHAQGPPSPSPSPEGGEWTDEAAEEDEAPMLLSDVRAIHENYHLQGVVDVGDLAARQADVRRVFAEHHGYWAMREVPVTKFHGGSNKAAEYQVFSELDAVRARLADTSVALECLLANDGVDPVRDAVAEFTERVGRMSWLLDRILPAQQFWTQYDYVLSCSEVQRAVGDPKAFTEFDKAFREMMRRFSQKGMVLYNMVESSPSAQRGAAAVAAGPGGGGGGEEGAWLAGVVERLGAWPELRRKLEEFVAARRCDFPRLCLLSPRDVLCLASAPYRVPSPALLRALLGGCVRSVHVSRGDEGGEYVTALLTDLGENVRLSTPVRVRGAVDKWVPILHARVAQTLRRTLSEAYEACKDERERRALHVGSAEGPPGGGDGRLLLSPRRSQGRQRRSSPHPSGSTGPAAAATAAAAGAAAAEGWCPTVSVTACDAGGGAGGGAGGAAAGLLSPGVSSIAHGGAFFGRLSGASGGGSAAGSGSGGEGDDGGDGLSEVRDRRKMESLVRGFVGASEAASARASSDAGEKELQRGAAVLHHMRRRVSRVDDDGSGALLSARELASGHHPSQVAVLLWKVQLSDVLRVNYDNLPCVEQLLLGERTKLARHILKGEVTGAAMCSLHSVLTYVIHLLNNREISPSGQGPAREEMVWFNFDANRFSRSEGDVHIEVVAGDGGGGGGGAAATPHTVERLAYGFELVGSRVAEPLNPAALLRSAVRAGAAGQPLLAGGGTTSAAHVVDCAAMCGRHCVVVPSSDPSLRGTSAAAAAAAALRRVALHVAGAMPLGWWVATGDVGSMERLSPVLRRLAALQELCGPEHDRARAAAAQALLEMGGLAAAATATAEAPPLARVLSQMRLPGSPRLPASPRLSASPRAGGGGGGSAFAGGVGGGGGAAATDGLLREQSFLCVSLSAAAGGVFPRVCPGELLAYAASLAASCSGGVERTTAGELRRVVCAVDLFCAAQAGLRGGGGDAAADAGANPTALLRTIMTLFLTSTAALPRVARAVLRHAGATEETAGVLQATAAAAAAEGEGEEDNSEQSGDLFGVGVPAAGAEADAPFGCLEEGVVPPELEEAAELVEAGLRTGMAVLLVGGVASGKTPVLRYAAQSHGAALATLNPNACTAAELYGRRCAESGHWVDGVLPALLLAHAQTAAAAAATKGADDAEPPLLYVHLDSDVEARWAAELLPAMHPTAPCLALSPDESVTWDAAAVRFVVECRSLARATPALLGGGTGMLRVHLEGGGLPCARAILWAVQGYVSGRLLRAASSGGGGGGADSPTAQQQQPLSRRHRTRLRRELERVFALVSAAVARHERAIEAAAAAVCLSTSSAASLLPPAACGAGGAAAGASGARTLYDNVGALLAGLLGGMETPSNACLERAVYWAAAWGVGGGCDARGRRRVASTLRANITGGGGGGASGAAAAATEALQEDVFGVDADGRPLATGPLGGSLAASPSFAGFELAARALLAAGRSVFIVGPAHSGKSTRLHHLRAAVMAEGAAGGAAPLLAALRHPAYLPATAAHFDEAKRGLHAAFYEASGGGGAARGGGEEGSDSPRSPRRRRRSSAAASDDAKATSPVAAAAAAATAAAPGGPAPAPSRRVLVLFVDDVGAAQGEAESPTVATATPSGHRHPSLAEVVRELVALRIVRGPRGGYVPFAPRAPRHAFAATLRTSDAAAQRTAGCLLGRAACLAAEEAWEAGFGRRVLELVVAGALARRSPLAHLATGASSPVAAVFCDLVRRREAGPPQHGGVDVDADSDGGCEAAAPPPLPTLDYAAVLRACYAFSALCAGATLDGAALAPPALAAMVLQVATHAGEEAGGATGAAGMRASAAAALKTRLGVVAEDVVASPAVPASPIAEQQNSADRVCRALLRGRVLDACFVADVSRLCGALRRCCVVRVRVEGGKGGGVSAGDGRRCADVLRCALAHLGVPGFDVTHLTPPRLGLFLETALRSELHAVLTCADAATLPGLEQVVFPRPRKHDRTHPYARLRCVLVTGEFAPDSTVRFCAAHGAVVTVQSV